MKKSVLLVLALALVFGSAACSGSGKVVNSAEELEKYLNSQPENSSDKPIKVAMNAKDLDFKGITAAIMSSGKYVSLDLSGSPIKTIPDYAFCDMDKEEGCTGLVGIILPNSVTSIGEGAFRYCESLASITIPKNVTSIGDFAFDDCESLASVTIPNSVTSIGDRAFSSCTSLASVIIPNSVTSIGYGAFDDCASLAKVTIPNSVTSIGGSAFRDCKSLTSITIPKNVTRIGDFAFYGCTSLTRVTFEGTIDIDGFCYFSDFSFPGDLLIKTGGGPGTYTRPSGSSDTWTKTSGSKSSATAKPATATGSTNGVKNASAPLEISPEQLFSDYEANEVKADNQYNGKLLKIKGAILNIGIDRLNDVSYITLDAGYWLRGVDVYLKKSEQKKLADLSKGQIVTIIGTCDGKLINVRIRESIFE